MTDLDAMDALAAEMEVLAQAKPCDPLNAKGIGPSDTVAREIEYCGRSIRVQLSLDVIGDGAFWHASISAQDDRGALSDEMVTTIIERFLPGERMEIPSVLYPGVVRQFIQRRGQS